MFDKIFGEAVKNVGILLSKTTNDFKSHLTKWVSHVRGGLIAYRSEDCRELGQLKVKHHTKLGEKDPKTNALTLLDADSEGKPIAQEHEILSCFEFDQKKNKGCLTREMSVISKLIKACVNERLSSYAAHGYNHINGAAILFCAEFAKWANDMAKKSVDVEGKLENELQERIDYLSDIEEDKIFRNEPKTDYSLNLLIFNLQQMLEKQVLPKVQAQRNCESSRELFKTLEECSRDFYSYATKSLFYLYTDDTQCEDIFDIESAEIIISQAKEQLLKKPLGRQFEQLQSVHKKNGQLTYQSSNLSHVGKNLFLTENGEASSLLTSKFFVADLQNSGIHSLFQKESAVAIRYLIEALGLLQDFSAFISAFRQGYRLSGFGGDIVMYIGLCEQTAKLIQCYSEIHQRLIKKFSDLQILADTMKYRLMLDQDYDQPWIRNYERAKRYLRQAKESLISTSQILQKMVIQMENVNSFEYLEEAKKEMAWFDQTIMIIAERYGRRTATPSAQIPDLSQNSIPMISEERKKELLSMTAALQTNGLYSATSRSARREPESTPVIKKSEVLSNQNFN